MIRKIINLNKYMGIKRISVTIQRMVMVWALVATYALNISADTWADHAPTSLTESGITGAGTATSPYKITTEAQLAYFGSVMNGNNQYWELAANVDMSAHDWGYGVSYDLPTAFSGHFDGGGKVVTGLTLNVGSLCYSGFIPVVSGSVENVKFASPRITFNSSGYPPQNAGGDAFGTVAAVVQTGGKLTACQVTNPTITLKGNFAHYDQLVVIGGMVGSVRGTGTVSDCKVEGGTISNSGDIYISNVNLYVGGLCGQMQATANMSDCATKGVTITLDRTTYSWEADNARTKFGIGGVIGDIKKPATNMPERVLSYGAKIKAPEAFVGPVVGCFSSPANYYGGNTYDAAVISDDYSGEGSNGGDLTKTGTWMYNGYKVHVDETLITGMSRRKNYTKKLDSDGYLDVGNADTTLLRANSANGSARKSRTVIWYNYVGYNISNNNYQGIFPEFGGWSALPDGYRYYATGYNAGTYVEDAQAEAFFDNVGNPKVRCKLTLVDENMGRRGNQNAHRMKLTVVEGSQKLDGSGETTGPLMWTWSVNGETSTAAQDMTFEVTPSYKSETVVIVTATDGTVVSYTMPRAFLPTRELDTKDDRGEENNPYVISNEEELRLWSELSRSTDAFPNGFINGVLVQDDAKKFNASYFELGADIEMTQREITATTTDGVWGTTEAKYKARHGFHHEDDFLPICGLTMVDNYDYYHTFRGQFNGKGHVIKNLHQIWRGGTLEMDYEDEGIQAWGLFGVVSGGTIKNLIIDGAKFEHDVYNGSFIYGDAMLKTNHNADASVGSGVSIGAVAGMITAGSVIRDVDVKNSAIYASNVDNHAQAGGTKYNQITICKGNYGYPLYVGGIVGCVQSSYSNRGDLGHNTKIEYVSSDVDIDIMPIKINNGVPYNATTYPFRLRFRVGGIVGSMYSSGNYSTIPWPEHAFYTGAIRTMHGTASPTFGYVSYNTIAGDNNFAAFHNTYKGYPGAIKTAYYNNYYLRDCYSDENNNNNHIAGKSAYIPIPTAGLLYYSDKIETGSPNPGNSVKNNNNDCGRLNPATMSFFGPVTNDNLNGNPLVLCDAGVSTMRAHKESGNFTNTNICSQYHGVNQGIWKDWTVADNSDAVMQEYNERDREYTWVWDNEAGRPRLTSQLAEFLDVTPGENGTYTATLKGVDNVSGYSYAWYGRCPGTPLQAAATSDNGGTTYTLNPVESTHDRYIYAVATKDGGKTYTSSMVKIPGNLGEITITMLKPVVTANTETGEYSHEEYISQRISQQDYYETVPASVREKTPDIYFSQDSAGWEEYKKTVASEVLYYDYQNVYIQWGNSVKERIHCITSATWDETTQTFKVVYDESKKTEFLNHAKDSVILKTAAQYYSYSEFLALDRRSGEYNPSAANSGFSYSFIDRKSTGTLDSEGNEIFEDWDRTEEKAGWSYPHRAVSEGAYTPVAKQSTKTTAMTVVVHPSDILEDDKYEVTYTWYTKNGTPVANQSGNTSDYATLRITNPSGDDRGAYYCLVTVKDKLYDCFSPVIFEDSIGYSWGEKYVFINPDGNRYPIANLENDVPSEYDLSKITDLTQTGVGNDNNDGRTPFTPVRTWEAAYALIDETASWDENIIVLIGNSYASVTASSTFGKGNTGSQGGSYTDTYNNWKSRGAAMFGRNVTIQSKTNNVPNYNGYLEIGNCATGSYQYGFFIWGDTRLRNMKFGCDGTSGYGIIFCQYNNLEMGEDLEFVNWPSANSSGTDVGPLPNTVIPDLQVFGGINNDNRFRFMNGHVNNYKEYFPHPEGFTIKVKSGFYSNICASGRQTTGNGNNSTGMAGCPDQPIKCNIIVDIDRTWNDDHNEFRSGTFASYDVGAIMAGNHEGAQYGDMNLEVRSGIVGRITSGSLGNQRGAGNNGKTGGFYADKTYYGSAENVYLPFDAFFGRVNILIDPSKSEYAAENESPEVRDRRVMVSEIYGGALGRHMTDYPSVGVCKSMFYGTSDITINGGSFDLNTADKGGNSGDGAYGLNAYNNTYYDITYGGVKHHYYRAQPGVYAGGAGGMSGIGVDSLHTNDMRLPYYAPCVSYNNFTPEKWANNNRVVLYSDYDTWKDAGGNAENKVFVKCFDGYDEEGRKHYTDVDLTKTTSTITINGGNFFPSFSKTDGTDKRIKPEQDCGVYGAGNGYVNNSLINATSANTPNRAPNPLAGSIFGTPGETVVQININGGTFNCDVYGGGKGNDAYYQMQTNDWYSGWTAPFNVTNKSDNNYLSYGVTRDNYGRNARIIGDVVMNINGGLFKHNIFGSGKGSASCPYMAEIIGNTTINITSDSTLVKVFGDVYGGGNYAKTTQKTAVNIEKGIIYGDVFGGGNQATVGVIEEEPLYTADSYWSISDNQEDLWAGVDMGELDPNSYAEMVGVVRTGGTADSPEEHYIGELKDNPRQDGTRTHKVGVGGTSVYTMTEDAKIYGNIYGGGNRADVVGDANVAMTAGAIAGNIFGGGNGYIDSNPDNNVAANIHGNTTVMLNGYRVLWEEKTDGTVNETTGEPNVITWTGDESHSNRNKFVEDISYSVGGKNENFIMWKDTHNVYGGGNLLCTVDSTAQVTVTKGMTPRSLLKTAAWQNSYYDNNNPHFYVFGGGLGAQTVANNTKVRVGMDTMYDEDNTAETTDVMAKGARFFADEDEATADAGGNTQDINLYNNGYGLADYTVLGVLGGGFMGKVTYDTNVRVGGATFIHRVYGGGYGDPNRAKAEVESDLGQVGRSTKVLADGAFIYGDIFGGGARGDVNKSTYVELQRDVKVYGSVYGGGDVANVGSTAAADVQRDTVATTLVAGGTVFHNIFAGGSKGKIQGSSLVNVVDSVYKGKTNVPYVYGDVYGGGEKHYIAGNSNVLIEGGQLGGDIFGGGLGAEPENGAQGVTADIMYDTKVDINGGSILWKKRCDDYAHGTVFTFENKASIPMSRFKTKKYVDADTAMIRVFYDYKNQRFVRNHNVYGGGNINSEVHGKAYVTMRHGLVTEGLQNYDQSSVTPFAACWYDMIQQKAYPQFSVFGGGYGKYTTVHGTEVVMNVANEEDDKYSAYKEDNQLYQLNEIALLSDWQGLAESTKESRYGGTNANAYRRYRSSRYAWSGGVHNHVMANLIGGSWAGKIIGNTSVVMNGTSGCRNIFGGGVGMATDSDDELLGEVTGTSTVDVRNGIVSGDIYGGGAGIESKKNDDGQPLRDYTNVARVRMGAKVSIDGTVSSTEFTGETYKRDNTLVFGKVHGGGDVANVGNNVTRATGDTTTVAVGNPKYMTEVYVKGGIIFSQVYGGGSGRPASDCVDYTALGAVYGNSKLTVATPTTEETAPWLWNRVYAGGESGTVYGNSKLHIAGGYLGYNAFGGGFGKVDTLSTGKLQVTDAAVKGNTYVDVTGGEWCVSQIWLTEDADGNDLRAWAPVNRALVHVYVPQYNPETRTFIVNHNIYGGGNASSTIGGNTYVKMTKGLLQDKTILGTTYEGKFFEQNEWREIYDKVGSAHFSVFGAGYGAETTVKGDTYVDVSIDGEVPPSSDFQDNDVELYRRFKSYQSLLDIIGGGYNGLVEGNSNVHIGGNTFMRRAFGGGYYAKVKNSKVLVTSGDIDEVFGGGVIGDVLHNSFVTIGQHGDSTFVSTSYAKANNKLFINENVYGANDVSGAVGMEDNKEEHIAGDGTHVLLRGGTIYGDVYGGGNGDYLYALSPTKDTKVKPNEHYKLNKESEDSYDLVYTVPMRPGMVSAASTSPAQRIVNINTFRPIAVESRIDMKGLEGEHLKVMGNVFGGGNSATIRGIGQTPVVNINVSDYVELGGLFLGSDGDKLFLDSDHNPFLSNFQHINDVNLEETVDWENDPANKTIAERYLPVKNDDRYKVYPHLLDLYFQPVEMDIQPTLTWNGTKDGDVTNTTIGIICCGGNRGNMNVYPDAGNVVDIQFPEGLTVTGHIIGGCNIANYSWHNTTSGKTTYHVGGYLLGERKGENPMINLLVKCQFAPSEKEIVSDGGVTHTEYSGGNVYGGCYYSGNIVGDVKVDVRSNMLKGLRSDYFPNAANSSEPACNVYGAGYGTESYVYGDTYVLIGQGVECETKVDTVYKASNDSPAKGAAKLNPDGDDRKFVDHLVFNDKGTSVNYVFGGGLQGNVVGNTNVRYYNGHTLHSVTGGSYAGYLWGSTQLLVGYPDYYVATKQKEYNVKRKDEDPGNLDKMSQNINGDKDKAIKQQVKLMVGDIIAPTLYEGIVAATPGAASDFTKKAVTLAEAGLNDWDDVNITIDEAIYGGGYSMASGSSVLANNTIVLKYDEDHNVNPDDYLITSVGYGGNTTMVVWDDVPKSGGYTAQPAEGAKNHIFISQQEMDPIVLPDGTDMFGYYYRDDNGHYHYVFQENTYFAGESLPKPANYTGTYVSAYNFDAEGGMYGDGHLSFSEGFRTGELRGYGFCGGKTADGALLMNSFQRMDILRLEDCNVIMLGARDYATNATNSTPYSLSRIGELQMVSNIDDRNGLRSVVNRFDPDGADAGSKGARNFLGLSNHILYVGCVFTNTPFTDKFINGSREHDATNPDITYVQKKQAIIDSYYGSATPDGGEFNKRNDATAKNMIGISSGYALKIQNVSSELVTTSEDDGDGNKYDRIALKDSVFYGPIVGVAEVNLLSARIDEGGGYIYSDNVHKRPANGDSKTEEDFLMTTGNFVFPYDEKNNRYILDDCYPDGYDAAAKAGISPEKEDDIHYWYIEGYNYYYQLHITGYTSDSRKNGLKFDTDNSDVLTIMQGAKKGQIPVLHSVQWRSNHPAATYGTCDLDGSYNADNIATYPVSMQPAGITTLGDATNNTRWSDNYYHLLIGVKDSTTKIYNGEGAIGTIMRYDATPASNLVGTVQTDNPIITLQLRDSVDNTTTAYYKAHLSESCLSTIVLTVPALKKDDTSGEYEPVMRYMNVNNIFTDKNYYKLVNKEGYTFKMDSTYYYFDDNTHQYESLNMSNLWVLPEGSESKYWQVTALKYVADENGNYEMTAKDGDGNLHTGIKRSGVFLHTPRNYTYTLYLTIDYVQGPELRGHIDIENCALPGEMVKLTTKNVQIDVDESLAPIGYYWRIGQRKQNADGTWEFSDNTPWKPSTATATTVEDGRPIGYDSYKQNSAVKNGVFKGCIYDQTDNYLEIPVYYFMNGYGVQYGVEFNGLDGRIFPVDMVTADSLLVHNFHRMDTHAENKNLYLHLSEAVARAYGNDAYTKAKANWDEKKVIEGFASKDEAGKTAWLTANPEPEYVAPLSQPRIYIQDEKDMKAFYQFVDSIGRYDENNYITKAQIGNALINVPTGGKYAQFYLLNNIVFDKEFYHTPEQDFEGDFDGMGYTVDMTNGNRLTEAPTLLNTVSGGVYNLGVKGRPIAVSVAGDNAAHIHNSFVYGMNNKQAVKVLSDAATAENVGLDNCYDLTVATVEDFNYGKVAYNLNKYYLEERYRLAKDDDPNNDRIEQYYANGDYQYARRNDSRTRHETGVVYLRTGNEDIPAYGKSDTRHLTDHRIDKSRAVVTKYTEDDADEITELNRIYNKEYEFEINYKTTGSKRQMTASPYSIGSVKSIVYRPLFNEPYAQDTGRVAVDTLRNDYLMFGQGLDVTAEELPSRITSTMNMMAANRVWRAGGFYGSKLDEGFYYNALDNISTMVHDPRLTAVDFSSYRDGDITAGSYYKGMSSVEGAPTLLQNVFYAPTKDTPSDAVGERTYWGFGIGNEDVTKNLLVYTKASTNIGNIVNTADDHYVATTPEEDIKFHQVVVTSDRTGVQASLLHLVDKEDFNAPIAFGADTAWYVRNPEIETGYVEKAGEGWESITLPYTVRYTTLSSHTDELEDGINQYYDYKDTPAHERNTLKGRLTNLSFFYGEQGNEDSEDNPGIIGQQYWLRGINNMKAEGAKVMANFVRPLYSIRDMETDHEAFKAYTPFVVSFPGSRFYEFDMTGQSLVFGASATSVAVTDDAVGANAKTVTLNGVADYTYKGAFANDKSSSKYAIALKSDAADDDEAAATLGDRFTANAPIYPFRAYMTSAAASAPAKAGYQNFQENNENEVIYISALGISLEDKGIEEPETEDVIESDGLRIYPSGKRIVVESTYDTTLNVYSAGGQLVRVLDVRRGTSIYSGFASGIYLIDSKKLLLK